MRSIEMSVTTIPQKSDIIKTKNVHLENKAAVNAVSIYVAWSETENAGKEDTDYKELKLGETVFFSAEKTRIRVVWAKTLSGTATLSITGSDGSINKPSSDMTRLAWYDRNPADQVASNNVLDVAPHVVQVWLSYTVPANKKAMVELLHVKMQRKTAAGVLGSAAVYVRFTKNGGLSQGILYAYLFDNTIGAKDTAVLAGTITMFAGDLLEIVSYDISTTGTIDYFSAYKASEYDA